MDLSVIYISKYHNFPMVQMWLWWTIRLHQVSPSLPLWDHIKTSQTQKFGIWNPKFCETFRPGKVWRSKSHIFADSHYPLDLRFEISSPVPPPVTAVVMFDGKDQRLSSAFGGEIACRAPAFIKQLLTTWTMLWARSSKESLRDGAG